MAKRLTGCPGMPDRFGIAFSLLGHDSLRFEIQNNPDLSESRINGRYLQYDTLVL